MASENGASVGRQTWALIRRYCINQRRTPFRFLFKFVLWPAIWMFAFYKYISILVINDGGNGTDKTGDNRGEPKDLKPQLNEIELEGSLSPPGAEIFLAALLALTITLNLYSHLTFMVTDKFSGMKSLMISIGLKKISYYSANFVCFMATALPIVLFIAIVSSLHLFENSASSRTTIMLVFILFVLHMSGLVFALNSLFKIPSLTSLVIIATVLEGLIHLLVLRVADWGFAPTFVLFVASADPYESVKLFTESYAHCRNNGTTLVSGQKVCVSSQTLLVAMAFWTVAAYLFAIWFDEVCPWQTDTAKKSPLYCLEGLPGTKKEQTDLKLTERNDRNSGRYFEKTELILRPGISIVHVSKEFSSKRVINDVSLDIHRGETTLLLGHNGAGKTTLMNIILGKLTPDQGFIRMDQLNDSRSNIGVCPQTSVFDDFLSVRQHMELFSDIKSNKLDDDERGRDIDRTLVDVSLDKKAHSLPAELSGGMKRKLSLGMAFVGKSSILILDEPSSGLDPDSRVFVWNAIRRYRAERTVLLSTQHMEEADYLGDRIAIMSEGKIICCGSSIFLNNIFGSGYKLRVECKESKRESIIELARKYFSKVTQSENEHIVRIPESKERILDIVLELGEESNKNLEDKLISLLENIEVNSKQLGIKSLGLKSSSMEDVLLNTTNLVRDDELPINMSRLSHYVSTLINPMTVHGMSEFANRKAIFIALMKKHLNTYRSDWLSLVLFRVIILALAIWRLSADVDQELYIPSYSPTFIMFSIIFHLTYYPVVERASGFKTMQLTSSADWITYWLSQLMIDQLTFVLAALLMCAFTWNTFNTGGLVIAACSTLLFGIAGSLNCYVLSSFFRDTGAAQSMVAVYFLAGGILTRLLIPVIGAASKSSDLMTSIARKLEMVFVIIYPTDALRYILHGAVVDGYVIRDPSNPLTIPILRSEDFLPPLITGFCALIIQILLFGTLLYLIEYYSLDPNSWAAQVWSSFCSLWRSQPQLGLNHQPDIDDEDVLDENRKAAAAIDHVPSDRYSLVASNLSKTYLPPIKAVDRLSFTVNKGECFGLLGVNGAGKSTTFSMLVAEKRPDSGRIWINGRYMDRSKSAYMQKLGYDPQANPTMSLTPTQALYLMARLRRADEQTIPTLVNAVLEVLDMSVHANKRCHQLSGGTMRKLSLGMSLIGNPELLALDEPTAGVDPVARRGIWKLLRDLRSRKNTSIVISSHAMEECEAICDRISIMARGRLRCIGTFLHLRSKFSLGCTVRIQMSPNENLSSFASTIVPDLTRRLQSLADYSVRLADTNINSATFNILTQDFKRSALFRLLKEFHSLHRSLNYIVNDSSLEDIFLAMAREQKSQSSSSSRRRQPAANLV